MPQNDQYCLVMEYVDGGSLRDLIDSRSAALSDVDMLNITIGIVAGLLHLHSLKIIHRDLAARNILVYIVLVLFFQLVFIV